MNMPLNNFYEAIRFITQSDVTASRAIATVYHNTTGNPIMVSFTGHISAGTREYFHAVCDANANPATNVAIQSINGVATETEYGHVSFIVPPNYYYAILMQTNLVMDAWIEYS